MMTRFVLLVGLVRLTASGCEVECKPESAKRALKREDIVFRGTISRITESQVTFSVVRVWKGAVPAVFAMPKVYSTGPCVPGFLERQMNVGSDLVVYAHWVPATPKYPGLLPSELLPGYVVGVCTRTTLAHDAGADLKSLGTGKVPRP